MAAANDKGECGPSAGCELARLFAPLTHTRVTSARARATWFISEEFTSCVERNPVLNSLYIRIALAHASSLAARSERRIEITRNRTPPRDPQNDRCAFDLNHETRARALVTRMRVCFDTSHTNSHLADGPHSPLSFAAATATRLYRRESRVKQARPRSRRHRRRGIPPPNRRSRARTARSSLTNVGLYRGRC